MRSTVYEFDWLLGHVHAHMCSDVYYSKWHLANAECFLIVIRTKILQRWKVDLTKTIKIKKKFESYLSAMNRIENCKK